jgi:glycosyltransferase involved in cell wall biosynthesis
MNIILFRDYNPYEEISASANRYCGLIDGICSGGHHVTICVTRGLQRKNEGKEEHLRPNLDVVYLSKANYYHGFWKRVNTYFLNWFHYSLAEKRLKKVFNREYDLIWLTNSDIVLWLYLNKLIDYPQKTFIELNEYDDIELREPRGNLLQRRKSEKSHKLFRQAVGRIDLFAVMTIVLADYYQAMAKPSARFLHLPMTVDLSRFVNVPDVEGYYQKPYLAFIGTMNNQKDGVDILIKSFARIVKRYPAYHLYLAGFWHYDVPKQDAIISDLGLSRCVHRVGVLSKEQIPSFICNATLLVLARPESHQAEGGFPTKLGEYLATGNPVCVTRVGEISNYLEDNVSAFLAEPGSEDSFADAIERALRDLCNAKQVGLMGKAIAEHHFDAQKQVRRLLDFLEKGIR